MLPADALDEPGRKPDVFSEFRCKTSPLQAGLVPDVQFGSVFVGAQEDGAATEAHLAPREFRNTLNDISPHVVGPSMLISAICTRVAQQPIRLLQLPRCWEDSVRLVNFRPRPSMNSRSAPIWMMKLCCLPELHVS